MIDKMKRDTHPSYGKISLSRYTGGKTHLFGSSITHSGGIAIRISHASLERGLGNDRVCSEGNIIEVNLSPTQFAEAITNMNTDGVPCTIAYDKGEIVESKPVISKRLQFQNEFKTKMKEQSKILDELLVKMDELTGKKGATSKKELKEVHAMIKKVRQELACNMPYMGQCWNEQMDDTVKEAKGEIEHFVETKVRQIGLEGIRELADIQLLGVNKVDEIEK